MFADNRSDQPASAEARTLSSSCVSSVASHMNTRLTLAPDEDLLRDFKRDKRISWDEYEVRFEGLMKARSIETQLDPSSFEQKTVLLCSEDTPETVAHTLSG